MQDHKKNIIRYENLFTIILTAKSIGQNNVIHTTHGNLLQTLITTYTGFSNKLQ